MLKMNYNLYTIQKKARNKMSKRKVFLSYEQMREIARYDNTFHIFIEDDELIEDVEFICTDTYTYSLEDLFRAVKNILKKNPFLYEFRQDWLYPITELSKDFNIDTVYKQKSEVPILWQFFGESPNLIITDNSILSLFWSLFIFDEGISDSLHIARILEDKHPLEDFQRLLELRNKPIDKWELSDSEMLKFLSFFREKTIIQKTGERKIDLANLCIDTLFEKEEIFLDYFDPEYLIIMGDIFYYGLHNHEPNHEKAFQYYRNAALSLDSIGLYKMIDMIPEGYGSPIDADALSYLYQKTYKQALKSFLNNEKSCFAQAALRCANLYMSDDVRNAYKYCLQAQYAISLSREESDFFGGTPIKALIEKALEEIRIRIDKDTIHQKTVTHSLPHYFLELCKDNYPCDMTISIDENNNIRLSSRRRSTRSVPNPEAILITVPEGSFTQKSLSVTYTADSLARIWVKEDVLYFSYDYCKWDFYKDRCSFYYHDELVAILDSPSYEFQCTEQDMEYWMASVSFPNDERVYDYICPFDVESGDAVFVETFEGKTEVTVIDIQLKKESELPIPVNKYKTIINY